MRFFYALIFTLASSMAVFGANPTLQSFENPDFIVDTNSPPLNGPTNVIHTALQAHAPSTPGDQYYLTINGTNISAGFLNPTPTFVPYRGATNFLDSQIAQEDPVTVKIGTNFTFATTGVGRLTIEQPNASSGSIVLYDYAGPSQQTIYPNGLGLVPTHNGYYTVTSENTFLNGIKFLFRTEQPYMMVSSNRNVVIGKNDVTSANRTTNYLYIPFGNGTPIGTPVLEGSHPAMYWDSSGDLLYIWSPSTGWHIVGTNIFNGTNTFTINPTNERISKRVNTNQLGDSPMLASGNDVIFDANAFIPQTNFVGEILITNGATLGGVRITAWPIGTSDDWTNDVTLGALRPVDLTLPIMATNKMYLSAGKTNDLFTVGRNLYYYSPDESSLVLSNATTSMSVGISGGNARISSLIGLTQLGDAVTQTKKLVSSTDGVDDIGQNGNLGSYHDLYIKGKAHVTDQEDGAGNYSKMDVSTSGGLGIFDYRSAGTGTVFSKFSFRSNGVEVGTFPGSGGAVSYAQVTNALALTGSTTTYLRSDGTQATPPGGGGGGNMTNSGPSVAGMIATATDTTGTQWTGTNGVPSLTAGTLNVTGTMQVAITNQILSTDGGGNVMGASGLTLGYNFDTNNCGTYRDSYVLSLSLGNDTPDPLSFATNGNCSIYNIGNGSGFDMVATNVNSVFNFGRDAGWKMITDDSGAGQIYNHGNAAGEMAVYQSSSSDIYNYESQAGQSATNIFSFYISNVGHGAGSGTVWDHCSDVYNFGGFANANQSFSSKSHMVAFGSGSTTTNSNDFVFGDNAYNYFFPGASAQFDSAVKVGTSTPWKLGSIKTCSAVTIVLTNYIEVVINGTTNAIPILTVTP